MEKTTWTAEEMSSLAEEYNNTYDYDNITCCGVVCDQQTSMDFEKNFIPVLYALALVLGLLGNGLVLMVLIQKRQTWSVTDVFILNLSVADLLLLITLPLWAVDAAVGWNFSNGLCKLAGATFRVNFYCGIFLLACISLDRYFSVVHAVQMYSRRRPWLVHLSCLAVWAFCFLLSIPDWIYLQVSKDSRRGDKYECTASFPPEWRLALRTLYHVLGFFFPAAVLLYCYTRILLQLQLGSQGTQKQRAVRVILILVMAFFISWTPYNIVLLADTFYTSQTSNSTICDTTTVLDIAITVTSTWGYLHCCVNPVLYAFVGVKFRRHLFDLIKPLTARYRLTGRTDLASRKSSLMSVDTSQTSAF